MLPSVSIPELQESIKVQEANNEILKKVENTISGLKDALLQQIERDRFSEQEDRRENRNDNTGGGRNDNGIDIRDVFNMKTLGLTLGSMLTVAIVKSLDIESLVRLPKAFSIVGESIQGIYKFTKSILPSAERLTRLFGESSSIVRNFASISGGMKKILEWTKKIGSFFTRLPVISSLTRSLSSLSLIFKSIGRYIFGPITMAIFGAIDFIKGALDGYKEDGIWGAIKGGLIGVFNGFISKPLDLLKDMAIWVSDKFEFKNFSNMLSSFSFEKLATDILNGVFDLGEGIVDSIISSFVYVDDAKTKYANVASMAIDGLWENITSAFNTGYEFTVDYGNKLLNLASSISDSVIGGVTTAIDTVVSVYDFIGNLPKRIENFVVDSINSIWNKITDIFSINTIMTAIDLSTGIVDKMTIKLTGFVNSISDWVFDEASAVLNDAKNMFNSTLVIPDIFINFGAWVSDNVINPTKDYIENIIPSMSDIKKMFGDFNISEMFESMISGFKDRITGIFSFFSGDDKKLPEPSRQLQKNIHPDNKEYQTKTTSENDGLTGTRKNLNIILDNLSVQGRKDDKELLLTPINSNLKKSELKRLSNDNGKSYYNDNRTTINNVNNNTTGGSGKASSTSSGGTITTRASKSSWWSTAGSGGW